MDLCMRFRIAFTVLTCLTFLVSPEVTFTADEPALAPVPALIFDDQNSCARWWDALGT